MAFPVVSSPLKNYHLMMDIAFLYYYANLGGVTSVVKSRMPALKAAGWRVHAFFERDVGGVLDLRRAGLDTVQVVPNLRKKPAAVLDRAKVDILTTIDMPETIVPLRQVFAGPIIYEIHTPIESVLLRTTAAELDQADRVLVPSRWSQEWVREKVPDAWDRSKVAVVPNIIDRTLFHPHGGEVAASERPMVVWVGKIASYKRWRDAVRVLGVVRKTIECDVIFITGGDSNERSTQDFLTELMSCGLFGRSSWYHNLPVDEMANVYRECRDTGGIVLSTSEAESFCLVAHEAMSCGVPVAAAIAGALPEVFPGDLSELLFDIGEVDHASRIIVETLRDRGLWSRLSLQCLEVQKNFDPGVLGQTYVDELGAITRLARAA
jgi:glycosyltransferase involved in cell wall biosynthesis